MKPRSADPPSPKREIPVNLEHYVTNPPEWCKHKCRYEKSDIFLAEYSTCTYICKERKICPAKAEKDRGSRDRINGVRTGVKPPETPPPYIPHRKERSA